MRKVKIDFLIRALDHGGAERQLLVLAEGLSKCGYSVRIIVVYSCGHYMREAVERRLEVVSLERNGRWGLFAALVKLLTLWRSGPPDLIHSYMSLANIVTVLLKPLHQCKIIWGIRSSDLDRMNYGLLSKISSKVEACLSRFADVIVANSYAGLDYCANAGFACKNTHVIWNGIEVQKWRRETSDAVSLRKSLSILETDVVLGIIGRIDRVKGHVNVLEAMRILQDRGKRIIILIVGDGDACYLKALMESADALNIHSSCRWLPAQSDMIPVYSAIDCIISASFSEGFSNVLAEAMACGVVPIATDVGDSRHIVGDHGWVIRPNSSIAIADAVDESLAGQSDGANRRVKIRQHIVEKFDVSVLVSKTETVIRGLLELPGAR